MPDLAYYSIFSLLAVRHILLTGDKPKSPVHFLSRKVYWRFLGSIAESQQMGGYQTDQSPTQRPQEKVGSKGKDRPEAIMM